MNRIQLLLLILTISVIPATAQPGVYLANSHTLFYLPMDGPSPIAPEGCSVVGGPALTLIADRFGNAQKAIHVSGTDSPGDFFRIQCTNTKIAGSSSPSLTVGYWTRMTQVPTLGGPRDLTILATNSDNGGCRKYMVTEIGNGGFPNACQGGTNGNVGEFISTTSIADGNWHQLVWVFDHMNKVVTLYLDGVQNGTASLPDPAFTPSNTQFIAGAENGSFALDGDLDDFWIEDHAWSPAEIDSLTGVPPAPSFGSGGVTSQNGFTNEPINTATGNYFLSRTDLAVPGKGLGFAFTRAYNSLDSYSGPLGSGWTHSFNISLATNLASGTVAVKEADGHQDTFTPSGGGTYTPAIPGLFDSLIGNGDGSFTLTRKNQSQLNFSQTGKLTNIVDRNGNTQSLGYDGSGNMISVTDTSGRSFTFAYDGNGRIINISDPIGRSWQYGYDTSGNLVSVLDAARGTTQYAYDANHRMISAIDPRGITFLQNTFDSLGRVATQTNGRGFVTTLAYNSPVAGTTTFTDPLGNGTMHVYDAALRLIGVVDAKGGAVSYAYDGNNDRTSITNQNGNTTNLAYDARGNVMTITDPLGNAQAFTYDPKNDLLTSINPKGAGTAFSYDAKGNLVSIHDAASNTTSLVYSSAGLLASKTDARGNATSYTYDSAGDLTGITDLYGNATTLTSDGVGRLLTARDPNGNSAGVAYDALNRIVKTTDPLSNSTQFAYDGIGNLLKITDANGKATSYAYDPTDNLTAITDALGQVTAYGYDANNNRLSFTNAKGNPTTYAFDALNHLVSSSDPLSFITAYGYDAVGNTVLTFPPQSAHRQSDNRTKTRRSG